MNIKQIVLFGFAAGFGAVVALLTVGVVMTLWEVNSGDGEG